MTTEVPTANDLWAGRGAPPEIDPGKVIARPIPIRDIYPDLSQPRRVMPSAVRGEWDGDPEDMPEVLGNWHLVVEDRLGKPFDLTKALKGNGDGEENEKHTDPVVEAYMELVRLAASIHRDGLINPARVVRQGATYLIESGERRWAAYWLLALHISGDFDRIPAVEKGKLDVWAQAAENGARSPLNAIGMARQLALLVMAMYEKDDGVRFDTYDVMVMPGECDRRFYAQVANGQLYRIKKGLLDRVLSVTGLKSMEMVSRYRALLDIPDDLWQEADEQDWTEFAIRDYVAHLPSKSSDTLPTVKVSPSDTGVSTGKSGGQNEDRVIDDSFLPPPAFKVGDKVRDVNSNVGIITDIWAAGKQAWIHPHGGRATITLTKVDEDTEVTPAATLPDGFADLTPEGKPKETRPSLSEATLTPPAAPVSVLGGTDVPEDEFDDDTRPLLDRWHYQDLKAVLEFLYLRTEDEDLRALMGGLVLISRLDLIAAHGGDPRLWVNWRREIVIGLQNLVMDQVMQPIYDFLLHLDTLARKYNPDIPEMKVEFTHTAEVMETE